MNAPKPVPTPPTVPMVKETIVKDDGRFLSYYTFPEEAPPTPNSGGAGEDTEVADV